MEVISQLADKLMGNRLQTIDDDTLLKYHNTDFEIIVFKDKRHIKNPNVIVVDKRKTKHVVYNDANVAMNMITL
jgi:ABC-type tungstate transport system permease subunit